VQPVFILGLCGSLRRDSFNWRLLSAARGDLPAAVELRLFHRLPEIPPHNEDAEGEEAPAAVLALRSAIRQSDAVLIATPEYNSSIPGQLKNALDWASRPYLESVLIDKPVAVMGASITPSGAAGAQADLRRVLASIGARVSEAELSVSQADRAFAPDGCLVDGAQRSALRELVHQLVEETRSKVPC
jgi:chromate reductase